MTVKYKEDHSVCKLPKNHRDYILFLFKKEIEALNEDSDS